MTKPLMLSQVIRPGTRLLMEKGDFFTLVLPSGRTIFIEVTQDTADVVAGEGHTIYSEDKAVDGSWELTWPVALKEFLEQQKSAKSNSESQSKGG